MRRHCGCIIFALRLHGIGIAALMRLLCGPAFFPSGQGVGSCLLLSGLSFRLPRIMLSPVMQNIAFRRLVYPHAEAVLKKSPLFTLPVSRKLDILPIHAGKIAVCAVLRRPEPQYLQRTDAFKAKPSRGFLCLGMLPESHSKTDIAVHDNTLSDA